MQAAVKTKQSYSWQMIAMLTITVVPIIAAYIAYYTGLGVPNDKVNEGTLLTPAQDLKELVSNATGSLPEFIENRQWRLIIPVPEQCDDQCQTHLYLTRQVHIRLGEKAERVTRYAVNIGGAAGQQFLQDIAPEHPMLKTFSVSRADWDAWLKETNVPSLRDQHFYLLVDQVGFAMMFYDQSQEGNQLLKDIKRVLRYSPE